MFKTAYDFELLKEETKGKRKIADIDSFEKDKGSSPKERTLNFIKSGFDPYVFKSGDTVVKIRMKEEGKSMEECFMKAFF